MGLFYERKWAWTNEITAIITIMRHQIVGAATVLSHPSAMRGRTGERRSSKIVTSLQNGKARSLARFAFRPLSDKGTAAARRGHAVRRIPAVCTDTRARNGPKGRADGRTDGLRGRFPTEKGGSVCPSERGFYFEGGRSGLDRHQLRNGRRSDDKEAFYFAHPQGGEGELDVVSGRPSEAFEAM